MHSLVSVSGIGTWCRRLSHFLCTPRQERSLVLNKSSVQKLGEQIASVSARASVTGQGLGRAAFPWQPEVLPVPKPRFLRGHS